MLLVLGAELGLVEEALEARCLRVDDDHVRIRAAAPKRLVDQSALGAEHEEHLFGQLSGRT